MSLCGIMKTQRQNLESDMTLKLYDYWRSSAAYRLRIALNLKEIPFESVSIDLHPDVRAHASEAYRALNPQMRVPAIELNGQVLGQSMAILEWLEETWPTPRLLPLDPIARLQVRGFADTIACDVHPLNNLSVLGVLKSEFGADQAAISHWYSDWITRGFTALEERVSAGGSDYLFEDQPGLAEICLIPQMYNARRFDVELSAFPRLLEIDERCRALPAFVAASPEAVAPN